MKGARSIIIGIIAGIVFSLTWFLMAKSLGFYEVRVYWNVNILIVGSILLGVFLSVYLTKRSNKGFLEFSEALKSGMLYCLVFAILAALFNFVYYKYISPDTIDYFVADAKKYAETVGKIKPEDIPTFLDQERARFGSFILVPRILFWGLITSLIAGLVFQKKNPYEFEKN